MFRSTLPKFFVPLVLILLSGCQPGGSGGIAVLDLDKVAAATGRDKVIAQQIQEFAQEQEQKLKQLQSELQQQVTTANEQLSDQAGDEEKQSLNTLLAQARTQLTRELNQARQSAQQLRLQLVQEFTVEVQPVARREAEKRGLTVVMVKQPGLLVVAAEADITDAVIDHLQAVSSLQSALPGKEQPVNR